jgi:hypothetical protein
MNYDDVSMPDANDDGYTPLQRPADLTEMMTRGEQPQERSMPHPLPPPPTFSNFDRGNEYGGRGRGHGHRGGRGGSRPHRGRGGFSQPRDNQFNQHNQNNFSPRNGYAHQNNSATPPIPNINVPTTPSITPQNITYPPMTPSPITPLPNVSFNFGHLFQPPSNFNAFPPPPPPQAIPGLPPPPPFPQSFSFQQQPTQRQPNHHQPPQSPYAANSTHSNEGQPNYLSGPWANNPAVAAALQRQFEEHRRAQGQ